jgi:hypothetical protein
LEILGKSLEKAWKRLGKVWNSLEKLARQASAHRDRGIGLALRGAGFAVSLSGGGLKTIGVVRCDQPRALDFSARRAPSGAGAARNRRGGSGASGAFVRVDD